MPESKFMSRSNAIRIGIVDDHTAIREGLGSLLSREPGFEVCGTAGTSATGLALIREESPSLVIIDISIGDESGLDLIRRIRELNKSVRILAWSMFADSLYAERALGAGAMGFINKRESTKKVIEAVKSIMAGNIYLSDQMKNHMLYRSIGGRPLTETAPVETLSNRELEVFKMLGKGMTTAEISKVMFLSVKTVETYRHRIKQKLRLEDTNKLVREAAQWVLENG